MHPCPAKDASKTPTAGLASENPCPKKNPRQQVLAPSTASGTSARRLCLSLMTLPSSNPEFLLGILVAPGPAPHQNRNTGVQMPKEAVTLRARSRCKLFTNLNALSPLHTRDPSPLDINSFYIHTHLLFCVLYYMCVNTDLLFQY